MTNHSFFVKFIIFELVKYARFVFFLPLGRLKTRPNDLIRTTPRKVKRKNKQTKWPKTTLCLCVILHWFLSFYLGEDDVGFLFGCSVGHWETNIWGQHVARTDTITRVCLLRRTDQLRHVRIPTIMRPLNKSSVAVSSLKNKQCFGEKTDQI